jgi:hypothetical protein
MSARLDSGRVPGGWARRHAVGCAACARFQDRLLALHGTLTREASVAPAPAVATSSRLLGGRTIVLGLSLAAAAVLAVEMLPDREPEPASLAIAPPTTHTNSPTPAVVTGSDRAAQVVVRASRWLDADPLRAELSALRSDAARGANSVLRLALAAAR